MNSWAKDALDRLLSMTTFFESDDDRLTINISGTHYEINVCDLINFPDTILGNPLKRARYLIPGTSDYFFPRHSSSFESILYYYINDGILIKAETTSAMIFYEEIRFFQLNEKLIQTFYNDYLSINEDNQIEPNSWLRKALHRTFHRLPVNYFNSSFSTLSAVFNALAIYSLCLETMSVYRNLHNTMWMITHPSKPLNHTEGFKCSDISLRPYQFIPYFNSENVTLECFCITWFYIELFMHTLSAPSFIYLLRDSNFALDILCILPTILGQIYYRVYISEKKDENLLAVEETQIFDYLTCFKLFRLFRLTRHAKCLEVFFKILYVNLKDIVMLTILIIFGMFYFGLTQFVLEQIHKDNEIKNIGEALWHGFTVITTIGYSDITEYQFLSYIFAIVGVWYGSISMAIILPSLSQSFNLFHNFKYRRHIFKYKTH
ncbi:unnamed protein product [Rotaria socialis]|uniref:Potassium channel n=1 Tax=Rotaria socialis TaxID=392032 RepID=A0A820RZ63_9BILA|nr:unnamed protein product [Rotaria socialis]CAF3569429.1 unnamed protein product [Rotaria socialis]CAF4443679.1 unnamed protein product [Rotaria socialis]CAF4489539.1 unnamed protein product [Rotaria socialis]